LPPGCASWLRGSDDDVHALPDELGGLLGKPLGLAFRPPRLEQEVLARRPAPLLQGVAEGGHHVGGRRRRGREEQPDALDPDGRLRRRRRRRHEEYQPDGDDERDDRDLPG
jgi:hypothetical protein